jgi:hypothetical protein
VLRRDAVPAIVPARSGAGAGPDRRRGLHEFLGRRRAEEPGLALRLWAATSLTIPAADLSSEVAARLSQLCDVLVSPVALMIAIRPLTNIAVIIRFG